MLPRVQQPQACLYDYTGFCMRRVRKLPGIFLASIRRYRRAIRQQGFVEAASNMSDKAGISEGLPPLAAAEPIPDQTATIKTRSLRASIYEGMASAVMMGAGENYLGAYAVFLQATALQIGVLGTLPLLFSSLSQLGAVWIIGKVNSRRRLLSSLAAIQAFIWILAALLPSFFGSSAKCVTALIGLIIVYQAIGGLIVPIWNSLLGDMVPATLRGLFFGKRSGFVSVASLIAILGAGQVLHAAEVVRSPMTGYLIIFGIAFVFRLGAAYSYRFHDDPPFSVSREHHFSFWDFLRRTPHSNFARFVLFAGLMNMATYFSAPYFAIYMLRDLKLSYNLYTILLAASIAAQMLTMQYWGILADRFGNRKILLLCAKGVAIVPLVWLFSANIWYLIFIQFFSGLVWAGYNLSVSNFLFDAVTPPKRARCVAYQSVVNGVFILTGSLLGAYTATHAGHALPFEDWFYVPASAYLLIFFISGIMRLLVALGLESLFKEVREVEPIRQRDLIFRVVQIRPLGKLVFRPIESLTNGHNHEED